MKKSILLLEDDDFLRDGLCEILESQNYSAHAVADVASARCEALESPFDLLILMLCCRTGTDLRFVANCVKRVFKRRYCF